MKARLITVLAVTALSCACGGPIHISGPDKTLAEGDKEDSRVRMALAIKDDKCVVIVQDSVLKLGLHNQAAWHIRNGCGKSRRVELTNFRRASAGDTPCPVVAATRDTSPFDGIAFDEFKYNGKILLKPRAATSDIVGLWCYDVALDGTPALDPMIRIDR